MESFRKVRMIEKTFEKNFYYSHKNSYHDKLGEFSSFVLRDHEAEIYRGKWNREVFQRNGPLYVEIGSGYGHFMQDFCQEHPHANFVGIDYRFKRSFNLAKKLSKIPHKNFRLLRARGERIDFQFGENEVDQLFYFFPDPWPKRRHHKKRPFGKKFLEKAYRVLKPEGIIFIKTDHKDLVEWILTVLETTHFFSKELVTFDLRGKYPEHFLSKFMTKFEKIFLKQNTKINGFVLKSTK